MSSYRNEEPYYAQPQPAGGGRGNGMLPPDLPVDIPRKSEVIQSRIGLIILIGLMTVLTFLFFILSVNLGFILARSAASLPDIRLLEQWRPNESTRIFDNKGQLIANIHGDEDRVVVPLSEINPSIQRAVMAIEDTRFYRHNGVDIRGTFRAVLQNARGGDVQGGSTLTQQLVKNLFLTPERSIGRKIAEALLAMRVEKFYKKNQILEMYLNQVYWGNQAYGIEKAARRYFKKPAKELTISESALLAGLLKAPEGLSPFAYPEAARKRQIEVLYNMEKYGYITEAQRRKAVREKVDLNRTPPRPSKYPYFVTYVIQDLITRFGEDVVRRGGLKVYTTLDREVQEAAEESLLGHMKNLGKYTHVDQGAMMVTDLKTGHILGMVGGVDFNKSQFNNVTQARRAIGSTFKPIVYLTAFRLGLITPDSPISDMPVCYSNGYSNWCPKNWDGRFMGHMNIRKALALSRNTPTVQIGMKVGIDEIIRTARLAGITSRIDRNSSSLLGSSGISPFEVTTAYATIARGGIRMETTGLRRVEDQRGRSIPLDLKEPKQVFEKGPVLQLTSILKEVVENGTGKNARVEGRDVAGKTGTTDSVRDVWFVGFSTDIAACVWMGNQKYLPLNGVFSSNPAKVWGDFAKKYYTMRDIPVGRFEAAPNVKATKQHALDGGDEFSGEPTPKRPTPAATPAEPALEPVPNGPASPGEQPALPAPVTPAPMPVGPPPPGSPPQ